MEKPAARVCVCARGRRRRREADEDEKGQERSRGRRVRRSALPAFAAARGMYTNESKLHRRLVGRLKSKSHSPGATISFHAPAPARLHECVCSPSYWPLLLHVATPSATRLLEEKSCASPLPSATWCVQRCALQVLGLRLPMCAREGERKRGREEENQVER